MPRLYRALLGVCSTALAPVLAQAQAPVRVQELAPPDAISSQSFGTVFGIRQLAGGKVLVNDGLRRQVVILDAALGNAKLVMDSVAVGAQSYGPRAAPLIPYVADSTLFVDVTSQSLLVIDPQGRIVRVMAAPQPGDLRLLASSASGVDARGNLIYRGAVPRAAPASGSVAASGRDQVAMQLADSAPILRANFETRAVDTIGKVKVQSTARTNMTRSATGGMTLVMTINPLVTVDEWAVLSDGTVAFVRGQDYHVDWIYPGGNAASTSKLPFDWKRVGDEGKQALIDSARTAQEQQIATARATGADVWTAVRTDQVVGAGGDGRGHVEADRGRGTAGVSAHASPDESARAHSAAQTKIEFVPLSEIADYYPAIRAGAAKPDLDGRLWILPSTSAQSKAGELVYDVVKPNGQLSHRVRLPAGRSIAGFGRGGVVYLMNKTDAGWIVERTRVVEGTSTIGAGSGIRPPN